MDFKPFVMNTVKLNDQKLVIKMVEIEVASEFSQIFKASESFSSIVNQLPIVGERGRFSALLHNPKKESITRWKRISNRLNLKN